MTTPPTPTELLAKLRAVEGTKPDSIGICTVWNRNPEGPEAADLIESLLAALQSKPTEDAVGLVGPCPEQVVGDRIRTIFAETAILLTHPTPERAARAKERIYSILYPETLTRTEGEV